MSDVQIRGSVSKKDSRLIRFWLTDDPVVPSGGYGGFDVTSRAQQAGLTVWQGRDPFTLTVPLLLDQDGDSLAESIHDLELLSSGTSHGQPPTVQITGAVMLPVHAGDDWVINDVAWGPQVRRLDHVIVRQWVTLTLLEHVVDTSLEKSTTGARIDGKTVIQHYTVRKKDTLQTIAAHELGDAKRWVDLATANGLRSSKQLHVGQVLRLP